MVSARCLPPPQGHQEKAAHSSVAAAQLQDAGPTSPTRWVRPSSRPITLRPWFCYLERGHGSTALCGLHGDYMGKSTSCILSVP